MIVTIFALIVGAGSPAEYRVLDIFLAREDCEKHVLVAREAKRTDISCQEVSALAIEGAIVLNPKRWM